MTLSRNMPLEELIDLPDLLMRVDNDRELLLEIVDIFKQEFPRLQWELEQAILSHDLPQTEQRAHALKGMLLNLSIQGGAAAVAEIERRARAGEPAGIEESFADFADALHGLLPGIDAYIAGVPL